MVDIILVIREIEDYGKYVSGEPYIEINGVTDEFEPKKAKIRLIFFDEKKKNLEFIEKLRKIIEEMSSEE